jgi:TM2 domain-containing membrane protein YozV
MTTSKIFLAILWNIFVIPGAGQVYLKYKKRGWLFTGLTVVVLVIFFIHFMTVTQQYLKGMVLTRDDLANLWEFSQNISQGILEKEIGMLKIHGSLLLLCYLGSIFDIFYLKFAAKEGRKPV